MTELVLRPLADAFMQVGVFVALLVAPFGWARYRWGHRLDDALQRHRALAPLVAAALTMPPGCGGAIVVVAAYARGAVSYGAAVAALVATTGDAAWALLAADPVLTAQLKALLFVTGALSGYAVDALGIEPRRVRPPRPPQPAVRPAPLAAGVRPPAPVPPPVAPPVPSLAGVRLHQLGVLPALLWVLLGTGATVSVPTTFQLLDAADLYLCLGLLGTGIAVIFFCRGGCRLADDDDRSAHPTSLVDVLRHGGQEVAFVTVWVAVAYLAWSLGSGLTGFDGSALPLAGLAGVAIGAAVGLIPGCGVQIVFVGLFLAGGMPLPTLVANTISQDGDALLPMLALQPRAAVLATVLTTLPAFAVGAALLALT